MPCATSKNSNHATFFVLRAVRPLGLRGFFQLSSKRFLESTFSLIQRSFYLLPFSSLFPHLIYCDLTHDMYLTGSIIGVMLTFAYIGIATANVVCDDGSRAISERSSLFNGIKVGTWSCSTNSTPSSSGSGATGGSSKMHILNLCSASCTTHCNEPNGTVPNLHDCRILAK